MEKKEGAILSVDKYAAAARQAVADGIVMLRNEGKALPLAAGSRIALFGRSQFNYYKSGTGSGGLVNTAYVTGILEAFERDERYSLNGDLRACYEEWLKTHPYDAGKGWAQEPWFQEEMPLSRELVKEAAQESDVAVIIIARTAGEDKDNLAEEGSYLLTKAEEQMLETVCGVFDRTVVLLNVGNIIDMKWVEKYSPSAVLYVWQGGQEGGSGVLDVLSGDVCPSGRLADTIARNIEDYPSTKYYGDSKRNVYAEDIYVGYRYFSTFAPERAVYPFGFGLSYTSFETKGQVEDRKLDQEEFIDVRVRVKNTGACRGKEVVQVYCQAPQGALGKAVRSLCGYIKTKELAPGEEQELTVGIPVLRLASYDDSGVTGYKCCNVLEPGEYIIYAGANVRDAEEAGRLNLADVRVLEELEKEAVAPVTAFQRMKPGEKNSHGIYEVEWQEVPLRTVDCVGRRLERLPEEYAWTGDQGWKLSDVQSGKVSMGRFLAQLTDEELCCIVRGEGMCSPKVTPGTAGAFGGVTQSLQNYGIPAGCCADGPSGIRMDCGTIAFAMPNGTCLACTFDDELVERLYEWEGMELRKNQVDTLLGPGMNIHRNPLNGRNFEYFSEDPLLTGRMAAAQLRGMHKYDVTGTIKHFACNNQEHRRSFVDAVVSERALREIYLKGFEIAVKEGKARSVMTSYNPINGLWTAGSYDLLTTILRKEWGFDGIVMTDWWAKANDEGGEASSQNTSAMVRAQNDIFMVTADSLSNSNNDNSAEGLRDGWVTRGEFQRSAANICRFLMSSPAFLRMTGVETELDRQLQECAGLDEASTGRIISLEGDNQISVDTDQINTAKGKAVTFQLTLKERGMYRMEFICRASGETADLAQLPMSVFQDKQLVETVTLAGTEKQWQKRTVDLPAPLINHTVYIKLFFGMSGMELKDMQITMTESLEERITQAMKQREQLEQ